MTEAQHTSPAEIEKDIRVIRSHIDETLDALQRKLSPRQLADQIVDYARDGGSEFASNAATMAANAGRAVRDNPIPLALLATGLAWLMIGGRREPHEHGYRHAGDGADKGARLAARATGEGRAAVEETAQDVAERARSAGQQLSSAGREAQDRAGDLVEQARRRVAGAGEAAADTLSATGDRVRESSRRVQERAKRTADEAMRYAQEHPFVVGAFMLAAGAAIAAMVPRTRTEDRLMGSASERVKEGAQEVAGEVVGKAGDAAAAAAGAFKAEAEQRGWSAERAEREAGDLAQAGGEAAKAAARAAREEIEGGERRTDGARKADQGAESYGREPHTH